MKFVFVSALLFAPGLHAAVTYGLRDARFFGTDPGRETLVGGAFTGSTNEQLPANYTTGGATPTVFTPLATTQASPFRMGAYNDVNAAANTDLTSNLSPFGPTNLVSLVQSRITETNVTVTGGTGTGYLLPTFRVQGTFQDSHSSASGNVVMCAGISACSLTGLANSSGGTENIDLLFTPDLDNNTSFTFGTPFTFFFFVSAGISSQANGTLAPGQVTVDLTNGVELVGVQVVDENGTPIRTAVIDSEFLDLVNTPEPGSLAMMALGVLGVGVLRKRSPK